MCRAHPSIDIFNNLHLTFCQFPALVVASTACVSTASAIGMTLSTGIRAVVLTAFFDGFGECNDAQARRTGTFHLGYGSHGFFE